MRLIQARESFGNNRLQGWKLSYNPVPVCFWFLNSQGEREEVGAGQGISARQGILPTRLPNTGLGSARQAGKRLCCSGSVGQHCRRLGGDVEGTLSSKRGVLDALASMAEGQGCEFEVRCCCWQPVCLGCLAAAGTSILTSFLGLKFPVLKAWVYSWDSDSL